MNWKCFTILGALSFLTGCDTAREAMGFTRRVPNEFEVVRRAPLEVPPDFALRAPVEGDRVKVADATSEAQSIIYGKEPQVVAGKQENVAPSSFMQAAGTDKRDPDIKKSISEAGEDSNFMQELAFWKKKKNKDKLNPVQEKKRLLEAEQTPPTA